MVDVPFKISTFMGQIKLASMELGGTLFSDTSYLQINQGKAGVGTMKVAKPV